MLQLLPTVDQEMDLDEILKRAETQESDPSISNAANELLSQFNVSVSINLHVVLIFLINAQHTSVFYKVSVNALSQCIDKSEVSRYLMKS